MRIFINAYNIHKGGGKIILIDLLNITKNYENINFVFYVDSRLDTKTIIQSNVIIKKIRKYQRLFVYYYIEKQIQNSDIVINLSNIPSIFKHGCKTILVQSNRFVIESFPLNNYTFKTKIRIYLDFLLEM